MNEREITCPKCGKKNPSSDMRYFKTANNLMCKHCVAKINSRIPDKTKEEIKDLNAKTRYKCKKCKNIFSLKAKYSKQCPFCGGTEMTEQSWNSDLDSLIDDAVENDYN
jgi:DNA-directed RNA polymerase subunit RPC12/RpoP